MSKRAISTRRIETDWNWLFVFLHIYPLRHDMNPNNRFFFFNQSREGGSWFGRISRLVDSGTCFYKSEKEQSRTGLVSLESN